MATNQERLNSADQSNTGDCSNDIAPKQKHPNTVFSNYIAETQHDLLLDKTLPKASIADSLNKATMTKQQLQVDLSHVMARTFKPGFPSAFQQHLTAKRVSSSSIQKLNTRFRAVSMRTRSNTMYSGSHATAATMRQQTNKRGSLDYQTIKAQNSRNGPKN